MSTRVSYHRLSAQARESITNRGISIASYVRHHSPSGVWHGDTCGCPDDRCAGHHHDADEECGCLDVLLDDLEGHLGRAVTY